MADSRVIISEIATELRLSGVREIRFPTGTVSSEQGGVVIITVPNTGTTYTVANHVDDRTFNEATVLLAELARVVGTLIIDLQSRGIVN